MVRGDILYIYGLICNHQFSLNSSRRFVEILLFQSIELEELVDQARLVLPLHSSIRAVVRTNTNQDKCQINSV